MVVKAKIYITQSRTVSYFIRQDKTYLIKRSANPFISHFRTRKVAFSLRRIKPKRSCDVMASKQAHTSRICSHH